MRRWSLVLTGLIVPCAAALLVVTNHFDGLYGQDAYAYFDYATVSLIHQFYPPPPFFWPPGYPWLVFITSWIVGKTTLAGLLVSLGAGGLVPLFTGLIAHELPSTDRHTAWIAALASGLSMAFVGQLWQSSAVIMADTVALAAATMGVWSLVRYARRIHDNPAAPRRTLPYLMLASGLIAYALITRWAYAALAVVCVFVAAGIIYRLRQTSPKQAFRHILFGGLPALIVLLPVLLPALLSRPGIESTFGGNFSYQLVRWDLANAFRREFVNPDGFQNYSLPNGLYYAALPARVFYLTPLLALFAPIGLWDIYHRRAFYLYLPILGWGVAFYLLLIGGPQQNVRFGLSYIPPVAIFIGTGLSALSRRLPLLKSAHRRRVGALVLFGIFTLGLIWAGLSGAAWTNTFIARKAADLRTVRWVEKQIPEDSQVVAFGLTLTLQHYTAWTTHELYYLTPDDLAQLLAADQPAYLLLDLSNVETQWRGRSPSENYHWLQKHYVLTEIGHHRTYTLFRIKPV